MDSTPSSRTASRCFVAALWLVPSASGGLACFQAGETPSASSTEGDSSSGGDSDGPSNSRTSTSTVDGADSTGASDPTATTGPGHSSDETSATGSTGSTPDCLDPPPGLVGFWSAGAQDGTDAAGGHHASPSGTVAYTDDVAEAAPGYAFQFDGAAGYLDAGAPTELALEQGSFTVFVRVRLDALTAPISSPSNETEDASIVSKMGGTNSSGWRLLKQGVAGRFWWCFGEQDASNGCEDGDSTLVQSTTTPQVGIWYSVAGVKDGLTLEMYVDAQSEGETTMSGFTADPAAALLLGAWAGNPGVGADGYLPGAVDDVMLFDRALTASEIAQLDALPICGAG